MSTTGDIATGYEPTVEDDGKVAMLDGPITENVPDQYLPKNMDNFMPNSDYVTAPREIYDGNDRYVFSCWRVTTNPSAGAKNTPVDYTYCYSVEFNLSVFQDSIVTAVYDQATKDSDRYDPEAGERSDETGVTITFMDNSRNQYNVTNNNMEDGRKDRGDRVYSDFLMSFNGYKKNDHGIVQLNELPANTVKYGLIVEVVGDMSQVGGKYVSESEAAYRSRFGTTIGDSDWTNVSSEQLNTFITSGAANDKTLKLYKTEEDVTSLDNKNRIQFFYSIANRSHSNSTDFNANNPLGNQHKVYRAYAYIAEYDGSAYTNVQISEKPVYFTIYDIGTIADGSEAVSSN